MVGNILGWVFTAAAVASIIAFFYYIARPGVWWDEIEEGGNETLKEDATPAIADVETVKEEPITDEADPEETEAGKKLLTYFILGQQLMKQNEERLKQQERVLNELINPILKVGPSSYDMTKMEFVGKFFNRYDNLTWFVYKKGSSRVFVMNNKEFMENAYIERLATRGSSNMYGWHYGTEQEILQDRGSLTRWCQKKNVPKEIADKLGVSVTRW